MTTVGNRFPIVIEASEYLEEESVQNKSPKRFGRSDCDLVIYPSGAVFMKDGDVTKVPASPALRVDIFERYSDMFLDAPAAYENCMRHPRLKGVPFYFCVKPSDLAIERLFHFVAPRQWKNVTIRINKGYATISAACFGNGFVWTPEAPSQGFFYGGILTPEDAWYRLPRAYRYSCDTPCCIEYKFLIKAPDKESDVALAHVSELKLLIDLPKSFTRAETLIREKPGEKIVKIRAFGPLCEFDREKYREVASRAEGLLKDAASATFLDFVCDINPVYVKAEYLFKSFNQGSKGDYTYWSWPEFRWNEIQPKMLEVLLAIVPLRLPPYVVLWILDFLSPYEHAREIRKIGLIRGVYESARNILRLKEEQCYSAVKKRPQLN